MVIKETFTLLKSVPNILNLSKTEIKDYTVSNGPRKLFVVLELQKDRIKHYTKDNVYEILSFLEQRKKIIVVNLPNYNLHVSYNQSTDQIVINISPYGIDDIYSTSPDPKNLYAQMVYGISFYNLVTKKVNLKDSYFSPIAGFILSLLMNMFGKEYGLLGSYSSNISKLNFLVNCYVLSSFFGITGNKCYRNAGVVSSFNFKEIETDLDKYDFFNIENFIKALSDFRVFPGVNKYSFTSKILKMTSVSFIPALEDVSRFLSIMSCVGIKGSNIVPTHISKYNPDSFERITQILKIVFK